MSTKTTPPTKNEDPVEQYVREHRKEYERLAEEDEELGPVIEAMLDDICGDEERF